MANGKEPALSPGPCRMAEATRRGGETVERHSGGTGGQTRAARTADSTSRRDADDQVYKPDGNFLDGHGPSASRKTPSRFVYVAGTHGWRRTRVCAGCECRVHGGHRLAQDVAEFG